MMHPFGLRGLGVGVGRRKAFLDEVKNSSEKMIGRQGKFPTFHLQDLQRGLECLPHIPRIHFKLGLEEPFVFMFQNSKQEKKKFSYLVQGKNTFYLNLVISNV